MKTHPLVPADPPGVFLRTSFGEIHVVIDGDPAGPAVLCAPGVPGSTRDFRYVGPLLADRGLCCVRVDLPGFGRSADNPRFLAASRERAALLHEVALARGHRHYAVLGHSFGGTSALACAALHAPHVRALVLVNSVGTIRHRGLQIPHEVTGASRRLLHAPVVGERFVAFMRGAYQRGGLRSDVPLDADRLHGHLQMIGGLDFADQRVFCRSVSCPTLVVSAADDGLVEPRVSFALAAAFENATLVTHLHVGHGGHFLQKQEAPAIADWLADRLRRRR